MFSASGLAASLPVQAGERDGVTEAAEPELSVVPQYLALGVSPLRDIWEG